MVETTTEALCETLMMNVAAKRAYSAIQDPSADDLDRLSGSTEAVNVTRKQLASVLRRPVVYKGRKFYRDKTGQAHFSQLPARKITRLGQIGIALDSIKPTGRFMLLREADHFMKNCNPV